MDNALNVVSNPESRLTTSVNVEGVGLPPSLNDKQQGFVPDETEIWSEDALDVGVDEHLDGDELGPSSSSIGDGLQEDDDYEEEEDDFEDVEPRLKYERLGNDLTNIFKKDSASCIAVNSRVRIKER
jgi:hypothetical protein